MTIENAQKKLTKAGFTVSNESGTFAAVHPDHVGKVIEFHRNGGDAIVCIRSRRIGDVDDPQSDYFAGAWHKNMTQAIKAVKG